jgi:predicted porin
LSIGVTYADVTLFGTIDQAYSKSEWTDKNGTNYSKTTFAGVQNGGSGIGFKGEEDLGNGLKASFLHELGVSTEGASATSVRQGFVALGGTFGQVRIGKQYSQAFINTVSVDPLGATGVNGHNSYFALVSDSLGGDAPLRQSNSLQYSLPAFVEGLGITLTKTFSGNNTATASASDGMGAAVMYSNGPIHAGFTWDSKANTGINLTYPTYDSTKTAGSAGNTSGTDYTTIPGSVTEKKELKTLSASYDLGMAKIGFNNVNASVGSASLDNTALSVAIPVGSAVIGLSTSSGNLKVGDTSTKHSGYQFGLDYNLSKRTVAYAQMGSSKIDNADKDKLSSSAFGIRHSF